MNLLSLIPIFFVAVLASDGLTPLMRAVATGKQSSVDSLLRRKVNLEEKNLQGDTALVMAIANDQDAIAVKLIEAGADIHVLGGKEKNNLVYLAASVNATKTLDLLVKKDPGQINAENSKGETALHEAARYGSEKTLKILITTGAKKEILNKNGKTPLDLAREIQNEAAIKLLK